MATGADCEIDFGVGRLHSHERQLWFVFNEDYQRDDDPFDHKSAVSAQGGGPRKPLADPSKPFISVPQNMAPGTFTATQNAFQSLVRPSTSMSSGTTLSALMAKAGINSCDAARVLASGAVVSSGHLTTVMHKPNDIPSVPLNRPITASAKSQFSCGGSTLPGGGGSPSGPPVPKQPKLVQGAVAQALMVQQQLQQQQKQPIAAHGKPPLPNHMKTSAPSFPLIPALGQPMPVRLAAIMITASVSLQFTAGIACPYHRDLNPNSRTLTSQSNPQLFVSSPIRLNPPPPPPASESGYDTRHKIQGRRVQGWCACRCG